MRPEIRKRIEMIRRGEVLDGFTKTKIGILPTDWKEVHIANCISEHTQKTTISNQYPVLTSSRKGLMLQTEYFSNRQVTTEDNIGYNILPFGYITFRSRSDDGRFHFNQNKIIEKGIISYFYPVFSFRETVSSEFMLELLNYSIYRRMYPYVEGTAQQVLSLGKLGKLVYYLPTLSEQTKIATILTTQDKVIELKEKRLAEKQRQKKYLMQQLLTGKKRLPGYWREWNFPKAKEVFQSVTDKNHKGDLMVLSATQDKGIMPRDEVDIDIKYEVSSLASYKKVCQGNFVISLRSFQGGIEYSAYTGLVSPAYTVLSPKKELCDEYYKQYFKSADFINRLNVAVYGIRDGKQISFEDFGRLRIPYPPINEQTAIAQVLSTADREISLLRQDIEQEKQKKKALMQLLLTGIVRVCP